VVLIPFLGLLKVLKKNLVLHQKNTNKTIKNRNKTDRFNLKLIL
jgi:hypothetical protein